MSSTQPLTRYAEVVDPVEALALAGMTFPAWAGLLAQVGHGARVLVVAAFRDEEPAGLILAETAPQAPVAEIRSLYVDRRWRRQGIGLELLARAETALAQRGIERLGLVFNAADDAPAPIGQLLQKRGGWALPEPRMFLFRIQSKPLTQLAETSMFRPRPWPAGYDVFSWSELTEQDRQQLTAEPAWYPAMLNPLREPDTIDTHVSLVARRQHRLEGWLVAHRLSEDTVRVTSLYVRPDTPARGLGFRLLAESIRRIVPPNSSYQRASFTILHDNPVADFVRRRVVPYFPVESVKTSQFSSKQLSAPP